MKLFYAEKDEHLNRIKVNFLGIRFKMSTEKGVLKGIIDGIIAKILTPIFIEKNKNYIMHKKDNVVRKLYITTGNINLLNNLALINQFGFDKTAENDVLVYSGIANQEFIDLSVKICEKFKVNKIYSFIGSSKNFHQYLIKNYFTDYDDVYFVNLDALGKIIHKIYKYSSLHVTDEGACTVIPVKSINYNKVKSLIMVNYLDKIDYIGYSAENAKKIVEIDKEEFLKVAKTASEFVPINLDIKLEDKWIIFCGTFNGWRGGTYEDVINCQNKIIDKLISKGYKILFKPHPRDTFDYKENENLKLFNSKLSMECYDISNVMAVVSLFSSVSLQIYYFQNVPSFIMPETVSNIDEVEYRLIIHYAPSVDLLCNIDTNCSAGELQQRIKNTYAEWLDKKPKMHENEELIDLYNRTFGRDSN